MDIGSLIGLGMIAMAIIYTIQLEPRAAHYFRDIPALMIVFVGTCGAITTAFPLGELKSFVKIMRNAFFSKSHSIEEIIHIIVEMSDKARKEGVLALQNMTEKLPDPFLKKGITMCVDGIDPQSVEKLLSTELEYISERHKLGAEIMGLGTNLAPALGLTGTIMAMVQLLSNMSDPSSIGPAMAAAFVCTFYGCVLANAICTPLGTKLKARNKHEMLIKGLILEGILAIQAGDNPRMVESRLHAYIQPALRKTQFE